MTNRTNFQRGVEALKRQQEILKALGFFSGKVDGNWGPDSIQAMKRYEASASFKPGLPNHGMPLSLEIPFPLNITRDPENRFLLYHPALEASNMDNAPSEEEEVPEESPAEDE
jgi:peptidoglycan hydrolase-like protein with peptidoglycan-binding domain